MSQPITRSISTSSQLDCSPQLQAVLGCLDIQLEEELTRYRRQRKRIKQTAFPSPSATQQAHKPSQVLMVTSEEGRLEPESADFPGDRYESGSQMTPAGWESVVMKPGTASLVPHSPDSSDALPDSPLSVPASSSAQTAPDRYLESSEALVKTIEERRAAIRAQRRSPLTSLFSPVGISSMLLLLLSSMTLGYVVLSPSGIATFQLNRFFRSGARVPQQNPASDPTPSAVVPPVGGTGQSPNLAAQEFVDLDLGTLSNISPTPTPISPPRCDPGEPPQSTGGSTRFYAHWP
ncbi:MAG: hypothetical protein HC920_00560 [Oscillatoriales cyanobacterium SM2_3_0]|nr:hypothetical protein [Oscillatoriales cyanobacterium SM2_3_0]